ncbi:MAG: N-acetylmuramoyl-L-alanine amidase [Chloroflexi bacterium]|nr:N-acetylmuramoyl-L-alanine amidase [Chloroflexota bacterium]
MSSPPSPHPNDSSHTGRLVQAALSISVLLATLFTAFSPRLFSGDFGETILALMTPQVVSDPSAPVARQAVRIGIVSGHWGNGEDVGAVCGNGVTEVDVNYNIAVLVRQELEKLGYTVDLLQEFDPRLTGYRAAALVSIHNDTCADLGPEATGYKVAAAVGSRDPNLSARLVACLSTYYGRDTGLPFHPSSITTDMTGYHAFDEMDPATTSAIIETGFLFLDYPTLTEHTDLVAKGIVDGIVCFVNNENIASTPVP